MLVLYSPKVLSKEGDQQKKIILDQSERFTGFLITKSAIIFGKKCQKTIVGQIFEKTNSQNPLKCD